MLKLANFKPLKPAERRLMESVRAGQPCIISGLRPGPNDKPADNGIIRAGVIRALALAGEDWVYSHEHGIDLRGAWIEEELDLSNCHVQRPLLLDACWLEKAPVFLGGRLRDLVLTGCSLPGLIGDGVQIDGIVLLHQIEARGGEVRLIGAKLGGNLECDGARLEGGENGAALSADGIDVRGGVFLRAGFESLGEVRLLNAKIGGNLDCRDGVFIRQHPPGTATTTEQRKALSADEIEIRGNLDLRGVAAQGVMWFMGSRIGGNFDCTDGRFFGYVGSGGQSLVAERAEVGGHFFAKAEFHGEVRLFGARIRNDCYLADGSFLNAGGKAVNCERLRVDGSFVIRDNTAIAGEVSLNGAHFDGLADTASSWDLLNVGSLWLDGLTYRRFSGDAPTEFATRVDFLEKQLPAHLAEDFRPQPFEQTGRVLRDMGHVADARCIAILKQDYQQRANWLQALRRQDDLGRKRIEAVSIWEQCHIECAAARDLVWAAIWRSVGCAFKLTAQYGYRPFRAVGWMVALLLAGFISFAFAYTSGVIVPAETRILVSKEWIGCADAEATAQTDDGKPVSATKCWLHTAQGLDYPRFNAFWYSLDTFVPILDLHQETAWMPQPERAEEGSWAGWARAYLWFHIIAGWIFTTLAVLGFTGLVKKDP